MSLTLVEAAKYSNDILQVGVIELLTKEDPILERLSFANITGNGLTYNIETTRAGADFYGVGDTWLKKESTVTRHTATTTILGGDAEVDNFLKATRSDQQDLMAEQIASKTLEIKDEYLKAFYYGYAATELKKFDGLHYLIRSTTHPYENAFAVHDATSGVPAPASVKELEVVVDYVTGIRPDMIIMSKQCRRNLNVYLNGVGGLTKESIQGKTVQTMFEIPVFTSDHISDDESCDRQVGTGGYGHDYTDGTGLPTDHNATSLFVLSFGPKFCCGIQSLPVTVEPPQKMETKDADFVRIKWYPGLMLQQIISCSKYTGISNAAWTVS